MQKTTLPTLAPHLIAVLFVIMNVSSFNVAGFANVIPLFDLMAIFYFAVFKNIFAIWFIFLLILTFIPECWMEQQFTQPIFIFGN
jgi:hypothetical protein